MALMNQLIPVAAHQVGGVSNEISIKVYTCDMCNYNCWYCYNYKPRTMELVDLDLVLKFACHVTAQNQDQSAKTRIELIGGEPTLHPEFESACKRAREFGFDVLVFSNLSQEARMYIELARQHGVVFDLSWHSTKSDKLNTSFLTKAKTIARELERADADKHLVNFTVMIEPYNFQSSMLAYRMLDSICQQYQTTGCEFLKTFDPTDAKLKYTKNELQQIVKMQDSNYECTMEYSDGTARDMLAAEIESDFEDAFLGWKCNAGKQRFYIHCDNNLWLCQSWYQNAIFYRDQGLKPILNLNRDGFEHLKLDSCICQCKRCACESFVPKWRMNSVVEKRI